MFKKYINRYSGLFFLVFMVLFITIPPNVFAAALGTVQGDYVNIRGGSETNSAIVGEVNEGDSLTVLEQSNDWNKLQLSDGEDWVAGWLVQVEQGNQAPQNPVPTMPKWLRPREDTNPTQPDPKPQEPEEEAEEKTEECKVPTISDLDVQGKSDEVTITIEATGKFKVNTFTLDNPERLVVDLTGIAPGEVSETINVRSDVVQQVRTGWFSKDPVTSRVVVDLKKSVQYMTSLSKDEKNLTLEVFVPKPGEELINRLIVIDAGHGGRDPGAIGASGIYEKVLTLDIAKKAAALLEEQGAKVTLARSDDSYVGLYERTDIANELQADLFVSVHINASTSRSLSGTSTYYYGERGKELSEFIQPEVISALGRNDLGVRYANFAVLRTSEMPAALVEVAFISNSEEEQLLKTEEFRRKAAEAITRGIRKYYLYKCR